MIDKSNLTLGTQSISVRGPAEEVNKIARAVVRVDVTDADALIDTDCPVVLLDKDGNELFAEPICDKLRGFRSCNDPYSAV